MAGSARDRQMLQDSEAALFASLGLTCWSRQLPLVGAPVKQARVIEVGEGPPVLFVHGAGMCGAIWAPLLAALDGWGRRAICVDLPGCGLTDPLDHRGVDLRAHARAFLGAVVEAVRAEAVSAEAAVAGPMSVVANSLGATYALYLAAERPGLVDRLVLMGAPGVAVAGGRVNLAMRLYSRPAMARAMSAVSPPVTAGMARRVMTSACGRAAVDNVPAEMFDVVAAAMRISEPTMRTLTPELVAGGRPRPELAVTDDEWSAVRSSTLLVWGTEDAFQSPATAAEAVAGLAGVDVVEVPGGHHPWWDDPARCADLVLKHLVEA